MERTTVPAAGNLVSCLDLIHAELRAELALAQEAQSIHYNCHHLPDPEFVPDQLVWLLQCNIKPRAHWKNLIIGA